MEIKNQLTIIIPCKNESNLITYTLGLLDKQHKIQGTRVIVSDSSDDDTRFLISNSKFKNLNIEIIDGGFPAQARNNGAILSETEYVLFLDADIFLTDTKTIHDSLTYIIDNELSLVTTKLRTKGRYSYVFPIFELFRDFFVHHNVFVIGGYMLFDRDVFFEVGGFNPKHLFAEDYTLSGKINYKDFGVVNKKIYTTDRRFRKKGLWYMVKMMILSFLNKNNSKFFEKHHNYWS